MWYSIQKINYTFKLKKLIDEESNIQVWFSKKRNCNILQNDDKINFIESKNEVEISLPNSLEKHNESIYGLYTLNIKVGNHEDSIIISYYPHILENLISDLEDIFCECDCIDCENCDNKEKILKVLFKTLLYYSLSENVYVNNFAKALKCIECDLDEESVCLLLKEKIYGDYKNINLLKKLLAIFYLSFYFTEYYKNCNIDFTSNIFNINKIKKCLINLGIDIDCLKNNLENKELIIRDNIIFTENRTEKIITLQDLINNHSKYENFGNTRFEYIIVEDIFLDTGDNNTSSKILLDGNPIYNKQEISVVDIENGLLKYIPRDTNRNSTSWFTWTPVETCKK